MKERRYLKLYYSREEQIKREEPNKKIKIKRAGQTWTCEGETIKRQNYKAKKRKNNKSLTK